ncbi:mannosylglycoprotein endo-beta-mannosidase [Quercus suber]|uniref:Mannosylglycoprotein endo-beta-mannosidase n=1 Tax=Quercus suber TaxID=58331 RepID=A0AAW0KFW3_QUESU
MKYPESKNPKLVYFLLLKHYHTSDYGILSRNFYWLHLFGGDYKLLEPYGMKKITLEITSKGSPIIPDNSTARFLPVHYSDNCFLLVSSKVIPIKITFKGPPGVML